MTITLLAGFDEGTIPAKCLFAAGHAVANRLPVARAISPFVFADGDAKR